MSDEILGEVSKHVLTGGVSVGAVLTALRWFGGRQLKQWEDAINANNASIATLTTMAQDQKLQMAIMGEQMRELMVTRSENMALAGKFALLDQKVETLHSRMEAYDGGRTKRKIK